MRPEDNQTNRRVGTPQEPSRTQGANFNTGQQQAAADIVRSQIDSIYASSQGSAEDPTQPQPAPRPQPEVQPQPRPQQPLATPATQQVQPQLTQAAQPQPQPSQASAQPQPTPTPQAQSIDPANPYDRSTTASGSGDIQKQQWEQYHSAWQNYYQRYYERYYVNQVGRARTNLEQRAARASDSAVGSTQPASQSISSSDRVGVSKDDALRDLRERILNKAKNQAVKVRKSRHFIPIIAAVCIVMVFVFLQYNRVMFSAVQAYVMPGNIEPQNLVVDPANNDDVGPEPRLIIPKINVDVPVMYGVGNDYNSQMKAMEKGVAHFAIPGANSVPGQIGNTVISGHSSNDWLDSGDYKFIFAQLSKLKKDDVFYANYKGKRYTYQVTKKEEVKPSEVGALVYDTDKPVLTLITCTPLGTALRRLLVTAEQISPDPAAAKPSDSTSSDGKAGTIPGNSPTFVERIFGG
ncbi:MAG: sortase [bacterium]|nr:sortase [bacterium]MDN5835600.1 sortase [bacterium]